MCLFSAGEHSDGDALYSGCDPNDLGMLRIEIKMLLYDHNSCSDSFCSKEDDLEALNVSTLYIYIPW